MPELTKEEIGSQCQDLLNRLKKDCQLDFNKAAQMYFELPRESQIAKTVKSLSVIFSSIVVHGDFNHDVVTEDLLIFLKKTHDQHPKKLYDATIIFYFWSEGESDNVSDDKLKTGTIKLSMMNLKKGMDSDCELRYTTHSNERLDGYCKKVDGTVFSFMFSQGTSLLVNIPNNLDDIWGKFYKGTYIATPHGGYTCAGIGLFQILKGNNLDPEIIVPRDEMDRIKAELYKKRFLVLSNYSTFSDTEEFRTVKAFKTLNDLESYYIRYRKSASTQKIHGDLIKIENFGKAIYKGTETENRSGRCFIQVQKKYPKAKNLVIELYQESDQDKQGFEFRSPHSFMMFDVRKITPVLSGFTLRPMSGFFPHASKCFLVKVDLNGWSDKDFQPNELSYDPSQPFSDEDFSKLNKIHGHLIQKSDVERLFADL